ncbi:MAG: sigma 54-interacting transcriptional regulator [Myxococcota bacterium]
MAQLGSAGHALEELDRAEASGRLVQAWRKLSDLPASPKAAAWRAYLCARVGDLEGAAEATDEGNDEEAAALLSLAQGRVAVARGEVETGLLRFDDAIARSAERPRLRVRGLLSGAEALLERDGPADGSAAVGRLADARSLIDTHDLADLRLELRMMLARGRAVTGDLDGAIQDAEDVVEVARREGNADIEWRTLALLAEFHSTRGSDFAARRHDQSAMEVLESIVVTLPREAREAFWRDPIRRRVRLRASASTDRFSAARPEPEPVAGQVYRLLEILKRLASERDLDRLLERITDSAVELSQAERGFVLLPNDEGDLEPRLVRGTQPDDPSVAFSRSIAEAVLIDGKPLLTVDAQGDARVNEYLSVHKLMLKSVACLPIRGPQGTMGVIYLEHRMRRGRFAEDDLDLLLAFADQTAIALENARLLAELEARGRQLEQANTELEKANAEVERVLVARTEQLEETRRDLDRTRSELRTRFSHGGIIGRSDAMRRVFAVIERVRDADVPVVIQGESGTGKELVSRAIHYGGPRAKKPFVALNCAAIPEALLESELFGHVKGAFTGADRDRKGVLVRASGGTLFLDEVGDMPGKMQVDLLRVLQDGHVRPIGGEEEEVVDVRIVAASNKLLRDLVAKGEFREDLYYRLNVVEIRLPPLRDRVGDLPLLCDFFLERIAKQDKRPRKRISREALQRLSRSTLPGNVRQLEHILMNACVMVEGDVIGESDLALGDDVAANDLIVTAPEPPTGPPPSQTFEDFKETEKQRILAALEEHNWNRAKAARALGIPRRTFYRRLKEHDIL